MYSKMSMKQRVLLSGSDAIDLLHRISTVNTKQLALNEKIPALILNPQGKIVCFFFVTKTDPKSLEIEFEENFLEVLDQFTFGERYQVTPLESGQATDPSEAERIQNLVPKLGYEFKSNGETNPLEVNLRTAIHDNKGCYPGQEVIEKIISLGSPAKKLSLLEGVTSETLPTPLFDSASGSEVGTLTSVSGGFGLGILKRTHLKEDLILKTKESQFKVKRIS
jgi:folate-binding protein YgfZ